MKTKIKKVIILMLTLNICLIYSQNFGNFSNIENLFSLSKQEVEKEIKNSGYQFKDKDKSGITTYIKRVPGYNFTVNLLFGGTQLKMIGWNDTILGGKFIVEDIGYDSSYKIDETKTDDYLGVFTSISKEKGFQVTIGKTIPNLNKGMISFTLTKIDNKKIKKQKIITSKIVDESNINNKSNFDYNLVEDSIVVNKKELLVKMFPKSYFINDSTIVRKQPVTYIEGGDGEIEYKTSVVKEYYYIDEKDYEEKVNVILVVFSIV